MLSCWYLLVVYIFCGLPSYPLFDYSKYATDKSRLGTYHTFMVLIKLTPQLQITPIRIKEIDSIILYYYSLNTKVSTLYRVVILLKANQ